jgi:hypothetical protein
VAEVAGTYGLSHDEGAREGMARPRRVMSLLAGEVQRTVSVPGLPRRTPSPLEPGPGHADRKTITVVNLYGNDWAAREGSVKDL